MAPSPLLTAALMLSAASGVVGLTGISVGKSAFTVSSPSPHFSHRLAMDMEGDSMDHASREKISRALYGLSSAKSQIHFQVGRAQSIEDAQLLGHGMPWTSSIQLESPLLYMPFWEWQLNFMKEELTNLQVVECEEEFKYNENKKKKARIFNMCFRSDQYRKIRMTYYDAGESCQVFNSLWYPDAKYNLPVLGIDLLAFNRKKHLAIVDFQPIHQEEGMHASPYEHILEPIKNEYPSLKGKMSSKFYDETQFFSQQMLFARFEKEHVVQEEVLPAFQRYVAAHVDLVKKTPAEEAMKDKRHVLDRQAAYDTYSADRDPATGLFAAMFGKQWADNFVYDFLFSMSQRPTAQERVEEAQPQSSIIGGPPRQSDGVTVPPAIQSMQVGLA